MKKSDWQSIQAAHDAWQHEFREANGTWLAHNTGQQWITTLDGRGFTVSPKVASWTWGLQLQSYGFADQKRSVNGKAEIKSKGRHISYHWKDGLEEWFFNDGRGLEHGFILGRRPDGAAPGESLVFSLSTLGILKPVVSHDQQTVHFCDNTGAAILNYSGLKVWDADGTLLSARFGSSSGGEFRLIVEEQNARYPVTIDPIAQQAYLKASNTGAGDLFGESVSVSGDTVVVGATNEDSNSTGVNSTPNEGAAESGAAYVFTRNGTVWSQQAYLKASNTGAGDRFGRSVSISGDTIIVGAYSESSSTTGVNSTPNESANSSGAAYVFVRSGTTWSQQAYLKASNTGATDFFGWSVSASGDSVVVGAYVEDSSTTGVNSTPNESASGSGAAYVFVRSGTTWSQQAYIKASNTGANDQFGRAVSISGNSVIVGAAIEDSNTTGVNSVPNESAPNSGAAYVFTRSGTVWSQQAYLKASNTGDSDQFGAAVSIAGDTAVVGAPTEDSGTTGVNSTPNESASSSGAAYVFTRAGTVWSQQAYLKAFNTGANDQFGAAVSVSGDTAIVGASGESSSTTGVNSTPNESASASGAAYVFVRGGPTWSQQAYLKASNTGINDRFGTSVSVSGETVIVGAYSESSSTSGVNSTPNGGAGASGAAYVFTGPWPPEFLLTHGIDEVGNGGIKNLGAVAVGSTVDTTFTISNTGTADLILAGNPKVVLAGSPDITLTVQPSSPISGQGGASNFTVRFAPTSGGLKTALLTIANNDPDEDPFTFTIQATGLADLTPSVTSSSTNEDNQTNSGLIVNRSAADTSNVSTHFKVTDIANGALYQNDGTTLVANGAFLTFAEANAGLRFTPAPDFSGIAGFNIQASSNDNDFGLSNGVVPAVITVSPVNDPPSFTIGGNRTHPYGTTAAQSSADGATGIGDGDPDFTQTLTFTVTNDNAALFTVPPAIAADGTLSYTPAGIAGTALVSVYLTDDATAGGPALATAVQAFTITVEPASNDSTIASISIGGIGVEPAFSPGVTTYTGTAPPGTTGITITPTSGESHSTIDARVNGDAWSPVTSGNPSGTLPLGSGVNVIEVRVTAQDGSITVYTFTITVPSLAEIAITGNAFDITNGDATPVSTDHTDFGPALTGSAVQRTFSISNPGSEPLSLTGSPQPVSLSGPGAAVFEVTAQPATTIPAGGNAYFTVSFTPTAAGSHSATVTIASNDFDEGTFTFTVQGTGVADITPTITGAVTDEDTQTSSGLVVTRNPLDGGNFSTHFKVTSVSNGTIYQNDGITAVADGAFLTFAQANAGLRFSPAPNYSGSAGFNIQASTNDNDSDLRDGVVAATITVAPVNDPPVFAIGGNRVHPYGTTAPQSFADGATGIGDGDPDSSQSLTFNVTNDNASIFTTPPAIAADGTLSYTPNGMAGTAVVSVSLTDDATAGGSALTTAMQTFTIKVLSAAELAVSGNNSNIGNGDATPDMADHTDFGSVNIADDGITRTFTISNSGETALSLSGTPMVQVTGTHAADFTVSAQPGSPVAASGTTTFTVSFDPTSTGVRTAELVIASDDADENPFTFAIRGEGTVSADSTLASITLPGVSLTPAFNPAVTSYTGTVPGTTTGFTLTPSGDSHSTIEVRVNGGSWATVSSGVGTTVPLNPGANTVELRITAQNGSSTTYTFVITRAVQAVGIDTLNPNITGTQVMASAVQPDGKILIGGNFTHVLGTPRQHLARLNSDGTLDATFNPKPGSFVYCISIQNDGKILIGGNFTTLQPNGAPTATTRNRIARLNADGTLDTAFDPSANGFISCILPQPDGKILLGGSFGTLKPNAGATISRPMLARVNADGTLDSGFAPTPNSSVDSIALQTDGRIILGGIFTTLKPNGAAVATARQYLARINADGTLDNSFVPNPNNRVHCVALQPDGKILLAGTFTAVEPNGVPNSAYSNYIARVNADGTLDTGFDPNGNTTITAITLQADGKILLGGQFTTLQPIGSGGAVSHNRLARLSAAGTLDASFDVQANNIVYGVALQADGKVITGGTFTTVQPDAGSAAVPRNYFARLTNDSAVQSLGQTGSAQLDWMRGGTAPEVSRVWFEQSTDGGTTWTQLGEGERVGSTPNWRITGLSLPGSGQVRARGRTSGGYLGGSSGLVETVATLTETLTDLEVWRQLHFGSITNAGDGANTNDYDHDGIANLLEHAFGLDPRDPASRSVPAPFIGGGSATYDFARPAGTNGLIYQAEWSTTMQSGDWHAVPDTGVPPGHVFVIPTAGHSRLFTRLRVVSPDDP